MPHLRRRIEQVEQSDVWLSRQRIEQARATADFSHLSEAELDQFIEEIEKEVLEIDGPEVLAWLKALSPEDTDAVAENNWDAMSEGARSSLIAIKERQG